MMNTPLTGCAADMQLTNDVISPWGATGPALQMMWWSDEQQKEIRQACAVLLESGVFLTSVLSFNGQLHARGLREEALGVLEASDWRLEATRALAASFTYTMLVFPESGFQCMQYMQVAAADIRANLYRIAREDPQVPRAQRENSKRLLQVLETVRMLKW